MTITDPTDIADLVAWFSAEAEDATYNDGDAMSGWTDQSGNGNHAVTSSSPSRPPLWKAAVGSGSGIDGAARPCVYFRGTYPAATASVGHFELPANIMTGKAAGEVFFMHRGEDFGVGSGGEYNTGGLHSFARPDNSFMTFHNGYQVYDAFGTTVRKGSPGWTAGQVQNWSISNMWSAANDYAFEGRRVGDNTVMASMSSGSNTVAWNANPVLGATHGASGGPQFTYKGWVSTVLLFGRKLTTGERADVKAWMIANPGGGFPAVAPDAPENLAVTAVLPDELDFEWTASAGPDITDGFDVRIDGGTSVDVGDVFAHAFTGVDLTTSHTLEARAYNASGDSPWSSLVWEPPPPPGFYRVALTIGDIVDGSPIHSWDFTSEDDIELVADYPHLRIPLTMGWDIPDAVAFFPAPPGLTTVTFGIQCNDASDIVGVVKGCGVHIRMFIDDDEDAEPWQTFNGVITQLDGTTVASPADPSKRDLVVTVYAADDNVRLGRVYVGYDGDDWPIEHIADRVDRFCSVIGAPRETRGVSHGVGMVGWLDERTAGAPVDILTAMTEALKDAADDYDSEPPDEFYGRYCFQYQPVDPDAWLTSDPYEVGVYVFRRRVFDTTVLDGGFVRAGDAQWTKAPGVAAATWNIVDGATHGTPDASAPYVTNTNLLDWTGDPPGSELNYSSAERDTLGEALLPDGSTAIDGWSSRTLVYEAWKDDAGRGSVALWASPQAFRNFVVTPVVVTPIGPELELNGVDYVAGTLTGARLVLPPGGHFRVEFSLRAELLPGTELP